MKQYLKKTNEWVLIDIEEAMQKLKEITFINFKYFKKIYSKGEKQ